MWGAAAADFAAALDAVGLLGLVQPRPAAAAAGRAALAGFALAEEFRTSMQILFGLSCCPDFFTRFLLVSVYRDAVHVDTASANTNLDAQNSWNFSAAVVLPAAEFDAAAGCWAFCSCEVHKSRL